MQNDSVRVFKAVFIAVVTAIMAFCLSAALFMLLWNWAVPDVTGYKELEFWQALVFCAMARLLPIIPSRKS